MPLEFLLNCSLFTNWFYTISIVLYPFCLLRAIMRKPYGCTGVYTLLRSWLATLLPRIVFWRYLKTCKTLGTFQKQKATTGRPPSELLSQNKCSIQIVEQQTKFSAHIVWCTDHDIPLQCNLCLVLNASSHQLRSGHEMREGDDRSIVIFCQPLCVHVGEQLR